MDKFQNKLNFNFGINQQIIKDGKLIQTAYFYPNGLWGRIYWYMLVPAHWLIFRNMIDNILKKARYL